MIVRTRAAARRIRASLRRHAVAAGITVSMVAVALVGGSFAVSSFTAAATANPAAALVASVTSSTPAAAPARARAVAIRLARYLIGLTAKQTSRTVKQIAPLLKQGETLDQIAGSQSTAVVQAAESAVQTRLDNLVSTGKLTQEQAAKLMTRLDGGITKAMSLPGTELIRIARAGRKAPATTPSPSPSPTPSASPSAGITTS